MGTCWGSCRMRRAASPRGKLWTLSHSGTSVWAGVEGAVEVESVRAEPGPTAASTGRRPGAVQAVQINC